MHIPMYTTPRSAGLPMTRNMPYSTASVPHRSRNLTGIYLGLDGNVKPPRSKSAVPPLARGRGMSFKVRTPTEDRRYKMVEYLRIKEEKRGFTGGSVRNCKSAKSSTGETVTSPRTLDGASSQKRRWGPGKRIDPSNLDDLIRPNTRNFTTVSNSGVTRSEKLIGWMPLQNDPYSLMPDENLEPDVIEEVHKIANSNDDLAGLEECYKRICKGNIETLYSLLPNRRQQQLRRDNIGFTVRSYRNPAKAEILAEFPDPLNPHRPKTVPIQRPLVPSPFFFRHHNNSGHTPTTTAATTTTTTTINPFSPNASAGAHTHALHNGSLRPLAQHQHHPGLGQFEDSSDYLVVPRILAVPGAGGITKTLQYGQSPLLNSLQLLTGKQYMSHLPLTARSADEIQDVSQHNRPLAQPSQASDQGLAPADEEQVKAKDTTDTAQESQADDTRTEEEQKEKAKEGKEQEEKKEDSENSKKPKDGDTMSQVMIVGGEAMSSGARPRPRLTTSNSGADIMLGLETDEGKSAEVEIDSLETDELQPEVEIPKGRVRKTSIVEKLSKSKESEMIALSIMENAGQRQREFEKLISEHQELVQEISRTPSAENIVQSDPGRDP